MANFFLDKYRGRTSFLFGLAIAACLGQTAVAGSTNVEFTTGGESFSSNAVTQAPAGNVLVVGGQSAIAGLTPGGPSSAPLLVLFQSQVVFDSATTGLPLNTPGVFTVTGSVFETVSLTTAGTVSFALAPGASNFSIFFGPNSPNSLAGTGFQQGSPVFTGSIVTANGNFADLPGSPTAPFDPANGTTNKLTVLGTGQTALTVKETSFDSSFVTTNLANSLLNLTISTDSQFVTAGAAPSLNFFGTTPNLPTINGALTPGDTHPPYDIQFQSNGSGSFQVVPEPASVAMTLMGLGGVGAMTYRTRRKKTASA
jgi:PEP-CTERM motif